MTTHRIATIARVYDGSIWAIDERKAQEIIAFLEFRSQGGVLSSEELAQFAADARREPAKKGNKVAVIPVYGTIAQRMSMMSRMSGGTSTEAVGKQIEEAMNDATVTAVVLDVDSPGGQVEGVEELAQKITGMRGDKPIVAVANSLMASAAYWIGSATDEVIASPSSSVGSIGVFAVHTDYSRAAENEGYRFTLIKAGKYKAEGVPFEPLSAEARAAFQQRIDETYDMFVAAVARQRGVSTAAVRAGYGQGRVMSAQQSVREGMADRVATLDDVVNELLAGKAKNAGSGKRAMVSMQMPTELAPAATTTLGDGGAHTVALVADGLMTQTFIDGVEVNASTTVRVVTTPDAIEGASDSIPPLEPTEPAAPKAEENTVSQQTTAAPTNGANSAAPPASNRERQLAELAKLTRQPEKAMEWILSGRSVEDIRNEQLGAAESTARPVQVTGVRDREAERPFASFGEQLSAVIQAGKTGGRKDRRLDHVNAMVMNAAASGMNESVGSEGGFFIQNDLLPGVIDPVYADDPILSRVTRIPIGAQKNGVKYNVVDETSRVNGSRWGGMQMYWAAEADTAVAKKPNLRQMELNLKKIIGIGYMTEELTEDAPAGEALLTRAFQAELRFMLASGIWSGTGAGQMQGFMNSGALVTQAIEATQTIANTATFISLNIPKMLSRIPGSLWSGVIWLYNQELLPYLLNAVTGTNGTVPVFMAAGGLANRPNDTILGRPAFVSEQAEAVGTPGDLVAVVPDQYHTIDKDVKQSWSVHVRFLNDENTLKVTYRTDGAPVWRTTVTPYKGANSRSPFVALGTRA